MASVVRVCCFDVFFEFSCLLWWFGLVICVVAFGFVSCCLLGDCCWFAFVCRVACVGDSVTVWAVGFCGLFGLLLGLVVSLGFGFALLLSVYCWFGSLVFCGRWCWLLLLCLWRFCLLIVLALLRLVMC